MRIDETDRILLEALGATPMTCHELVAEMEAAFAPTSYGRIAGKLRKLRRYDLIQSIDVRPGWSYLWMLTDKGLVERAAPR